MCILSASRQRRRHRKRDKELKRKRGKFHGLYLTYRIPGIAYFSDFMVALGQVLVVLVAPESHSSCACVRDTPPRAYLDT